MNLCIEKRARVFECEFRAGNDAGVIEGILVRYNEPVNLGEFKEQFRSGAFTPIGDVIANLQHDRGKPLARNSEGGGLELIDGQDELKARIDLPDTSIGRDTRELVKRGILRGLSLEFAVTEEKYNEGLRDISKAQLIGLGIVDRPQHPASVITKRNSEMFLSVDDPVNDPLCFERGGGVLFPYI